MKSVEGNMKRNGMTRTGLLGVLLAGAGMLGCGLYPDPVPPPLQPPATPPTVATKVGGVFMDPATEAPIEDSIAVTLLDADGEPSSLTETTEGIATNAFTVTDGVLSFAVSDGASFPLELIVTAEADGYNSTSETLVLEEAGEHEFVAQMVNVAEPPEGVVAVQVSAGTADDTTGETAAPIEVDTPEETSSEGTTKVSIPTATVLTTKNGTPLTGALTATVAYYNNSDSKSLSSFPGGLSAGVAPASGSVAPSGLGSFGGIYPSAATAAVASEAFITGGFTSLGFTDGSGNQAAEVDNELEIAIAVPSSTVNPDTGAAIANGDLVPVWSYDHETGLWTNEGDVALEPRPDETAIGDGTEPAAYAAVFHRFRSRFRSYYIPRYYSVAWRTPTCSLSRPFNIVGNPDGVALTLELTRVGGGSFKRFTTSAPNINTARVPNVVSGQSFNIVAKFQGNSVGNVTVANLCTTTAQSLNVTLPNVSPASVAVTVRDVCAADATRVTPVPSASVTLLPKTAGESPRTRQTGANGTVEFSGLYSGANYELRAENRTNGGAFGAQSVTLSAGANEILFENSVDCARITGSSGG